MTRASGAEEGDKERSAAVVMAVHLPATNTARVFVLPITHAAPARGTEAMEIPAPVCRSAGLDAARSWVILSEFNALAWPGFDLAHVPGRTPRPVAYGFLTRASSRGCATAGWHSMPPPGRGVCRATRRTRGVSDRTYLRTIVFADSPAHTLITAENAPRVRPPRGSRQWRNARPGAALRWPLPLPHQPQHRRRIDHPAVTLKTLQRRGMPCLALRHARILHAIHKVPRGRRHPSPHDRRTGRSGSPPRTHPRCRCCAAGNQASSSEHRRRGLRQQHLVPQRTTSANGRASHDPLP